MFVGQEGISAAVLHARNRWKIVRSAGNVFLLLLFFGGWVGVGVGGGGLGGGGGGRYVSLQCLLISMWLCSNVSKQSSHRSDQSIENRRFWSEVLYTIHTDYSMKWKNKWAIVKLLEKLSRTGPYPWRDPIKLWLQITYDYFRFIGVPIS